MLTAWTRNLDSASAAKLLLSAADKKLVDDEKIRILQDAKRTEQSGLGKIEGLLAVF